MSSASLDKVINDVVNEALSEYRALLEKARQEAHSILEARAEEASKAAAEMAEEGARRRESLRQRIISLAEINARNKSIEVMEDGINRAIQEALKRIEAISSREELRDIVGNLLAEAVEAVRAEEVIVQTNAKSLEVLREVVPEAQNTLGVRITVDETPVNTICGVRVRSVDGRVIYDNTVETRVERVRQSLRRELASLFSD